MSGEAPTPSGSAAGPQIGVDEWVRRSGERITGPDGIVGTLYRTADRIPRIALLAAFVATAACIPFMTSDGYVQGVATDTMLYVLLAVGLNVAVGWAGLLDLGYVAFYGFAAYLYAALSGSRLLTGQQLLADWSTWQAVPVVVAATIVLGFVLALPTRRLRGDYLAIVTLFFLEIFNNFTSNGDRWNWLGLGGTHDVTGGTTGLIDTHPWRVAGRPLTNYSRDYLWVALAGFTVIAIALTYANRSRTGRAWRALREDPLAAEVMGTPVKWLMLVGVAVGAGVAGFAGAVNGAYYQQVSPTSFSFQLLITVYAMLILGGAGSLGGVVCGAVVVNVLLEVLRFPDHARWVFYAALLVGLVAKVRPWRLLAGVLGGLVAFGLVVNAVVGVVWPRGVHGPLAVGADSFTQHGLLADVLHHWLILPKNTYEAADYRIGNYVFVVVIGLVLALTLLHGWRRWVLAVPTVWGACFVWETVLIEQAPTTRPLFLGVILIVLMTTRPAGLFGQTRVEVV
jgi:ABC-type branched-subunit amino acid transport system permease subunit